MKLNINPQLFTMYPELVLGVLSVKNIDNSGNDSDLLTLLRSAEQKALNSISAIPIIEHPYIAPWREAYRLFGAKPKKYPSSIENLIRRIANGEQIRHINKLVDIYNVISLTNIVPAGGEDLDKMVGDLKLTIATDKEAPVKLLGEPEERPPYPNEVIYKDEVGTICRRWNWKEADRTKLTESTKNAVLVIEGIPPVNQPVVEAAIKQLATMVQKYCGGNITAHILNISKNEADL
jgi:DNA/RNA-binding domain of Phe-tRNA-synthetase-like protein